MHDKNEKLKRQSMSLLTLIGKGDVSVADLKLDSDDEDETDTVDSKSDDTPDDKIGGVVL